LEVLNSTALDLKFLATVRAVSVPLLYPISLHSNLQLQMFDQRRVYFGPRSLQGGHAVRRDRDLALFPSEFDLTFGGGGKLRPSVHGHGGIVVGS
jgi:hypothetical protein